LAEIFVVVVQQDKSGCFMGHSVQRAICGRHCRTLTVTWRLCLVELWLWRDGCVFYRVPDADQQFQRRVTAWSSDRKTASRDDQCSTERYWATTVWSLPQVRPLDILQTGFTRQINCR